MTMVTPLATTSRRSYAPALNVPKNEDLGDMKYFRWPSDPAETEVKHQYVSEAVPITNARQVTLPYLRITGVGKRKSGLVQFSLQEYAPWLKELDAVLQKREEYKYGIDVFHLLERTKKAMQRPLKDHEHDNWYPLLDREDKLIFKEAGIPPFAHTSTLDVFVTVALSQLIPCPQGARPQLTKVQPIWARI